MRARNCAASYAGSVMSAMEDGVTATSTLFCSEKGAWHELSLKRHWHLGLNRGRIQNLGPDQKWALRQNLIHRLAQKPLNELMTRRPTPH
jgi:hypothetical protein